MDDSGGKDADKNGRWSQVVVDVTTVMGVRMETVALLPPLMTPVGGDGEGGSGTGVGSRDVSEGDALGASLSGRQPGNPTFSSVFLPQYPQQHHAMTPGSHRMGAGVATVGKPVTLQCSSVTLAMPCRGAQRSAV